MTIKYLPEDVDEVIRGILRVDNITWIHWLPLTEIAMQDCNLWKDAFCRIGSNKKQFELLEKMRLPDSGVFADILLKILAENASDINDPDVRQFVLDDGVDACKRHESRIQAMRDILDPLLKNASDVKNRIKDGFDIIKEIARLEAEIAEMKKNENALDERFVKLHALERDIVRYETLKRRVESYNFTEKEQYLKDLQAEYEQLRHRKENLQKNISEAIANRDEAEREYKALENQLSEIKESRAKIDKSLIEIKKEIEEMSKQSKIAEQELLQSDEEHKRLLTQIEQLEKNNNEAGQRLKESKRRLEQLQKEAKDAGYIDIETRIRDIYALLLDDLADRACKRG